MSFASLTERLRGWKSEVKRTLEPPDASRAASHSPEWYAGLAVSPSAFSRQLGDMQLSMLRETSRRPGVSEVSTRELIANDERVRSGVNH